MKTTTEISITGMKPKVQERSEVREQPKMQEQPKVQEQLKAASAPVGTPQKGKKND